MSKGALMACAAGVRVLAEAALDWVYPRHCYDCGRPIYEPGRSVLCRDCARLLQETRLDGHVCSVCGMPLPAAPGDGALCLTCMAEERYFDRARSFFSYAGPVAPVIRSFKFRGEFFLGPRLLEHALRRGWMPPQLEPPAAIVPVPLHRRRRRERGYNQAALLGRVLARHFRCPLIDRALKRTRHTSRQTGLSRTRRLDNVRGAFAITRPRAVRKMNLLVVDDVMTTGATVDECCKVLKRADAATVQALTLARAMR